MADHSLDIPSWYVTSQSGKLSLLLSAGWEISATQGAPAVLLGWEGKHRSGVTVAMHQKLCGRSTDALSGLRNGEQHHAYALIGVRHPLCLPTYSTCNIFSSMVCIPQRLE